MSFFSSPPASPSSSSSSSSVSSSSTSAVSVPPSSSSSSSFSSSSSPPPPSSSSSSSSSACLSSMLSVGSGKANTSPSKRLYTRCFFRCVQLTDFGEKVVVVGSNPQLGNWVVSRGHELSTSDELQPAWFSKEPVYLPLKQNVQYKYVIIDENGEVKRWEEYEGNRTIIPTGIEMTIEDDNGLVREQTTSQLLNLNVDSELEVQSLDAKQREALEAKYKVQQLHEQEKEPHIDSNDTLVVCAFELPLRVARNDSGGFDVYPTKTALLPSLHKLRQTAKLPVKFIGWPGITIDDKDEQEQVAKLLESYDCIPVFPPKNEMEQYLQFCHRFLWPLFHNVVILDTQKQEPFNSALWKCYQKVNMLWAERVVSNAHENDLIWVHDYQLLLLPMCITRRARKANVGVFLHIPFPSSEVFRCLPVREEIIRGMLCADLIGFHFFEYARHFLVACKRLLGIDYHFRLGGFVGVEYLGRNVMVRIGHVHIQYNDLRLKIETSSEIKQKTSEIRKQFEGKYIFASVDRCERLAGLLLKVRAFQNFLNNYSFAQGKVVLIQYAYTTISYWEDTNKMRSELIELIDKVNRDFAIHDDEDRGVDTGHPHNGEKHIYLHLREVPWEEKYALFQAADCLLDTSIRDGLNLNPFEFICCHKNNIASVILSEFTGCSRALASAIRCNPWKVESVAEAMDRAMNTSYEENSDRFMRDQAYLQHNNTLKWAEEFLLDLRRARKREDMVYMPCGFGNTFRVLGIDSHFKALDPNEVVSALKNSVRQRVFFFDHEGTLAPDRRRITAVPGTEMLFSEGSPPIALVKDCLRSLLQDSKNTVIILSGRDKDLLEAWFKDVKGIGFCAEHGFYYMVPSITGDKWQCMSQHADFTWKEVAMELMIQYVKRTQGAFIENKGSALVFQYRDADLEFGSMQAKELSNYLSELLFGYPVTVVSGKGYVEVKLRGVNKGRAVEKLLKKIINIHGDVDFVLCVGDDRSDEDMLAVINEFAGEYDGTGEYGEMQSICGMDSVKHRKHSASSEDNCGAGGGVGGLAGLDRRGSGTLRNFNAAGGNISVQNLQPSLSRAGTGLNAHYFTCTVGKKPSNAKYYLNDTEEVSELLEALRQVVEKQKYNLQSAPLRMPSAPYFEISQKPSTFFPMSPPSQHAHTHTHTGRPAHTFIPSSSLHNTSSSDPSTVPRVYPGCAGHIGGKYTDFSPPSQVFGMPMSPATRSPVRRFMDASSAQGSSSSGSSSGSNSGNNGGNTTRQGSGENAEGVSPSSSINDNNAASLSSPSSSAMDNNNNNSSSSFSSS